MPKPTKDLKGQTFTRLTVLHRDLTKPGKTRWMCRCECGVIKSVSAETLLCGKAKSCGCYSVDRIAALNKTHGLSKKHPLYNTWMLMRRRCNSPNSKAYSRYGGRGIKIDESWDDFNVFAADMGEKPEGTSLDRIDNNQGYSKENCRWATPTEQCSNTRRNKLIEFEGEQLTLGEIARRTSTNEKHLRSLFVEGNHSLDYAIKAELHQKKLNQTMADEIRVKHKYGRSGVSLAAEYGVSKCTISLTVLNKIWNKKRPPLSTITAKPSGGVNDASAIA